MAKKIKTNALRLLDQAKIDYEIKEYEYDEDHLSGEHIVAQVEIPAKDIFKTLVLKGNRGFLVCCIPVLEEIDLKKLAKLSNNKSVAMIHMKDLLATTGYIRGGCTAIGMKKDYPTVLDASANDQEKIIVSGGKNGIQIELTTKDYLKACKGKTADITL